MVFKIIVKLVLSLLFANIALAFALGWKAFTPKEKKQNIFVLIIFFIVMILAPWVFL